MTSFINASLDQSFAHTETTHYSRLHRLWQLDKSVFVNRYWTLSFPSFLPALLLSSGSLPYAFYCISVVSYKVLILTAEPSSRQRGRYKITQQQLCKRKSLGERKIGRGSQMGAWHQDWLADWLSVVMWLRLRLLNIIIWNERHPNFFHNWLFINSLK
jgi:hypothetical protein